MSADKTRAVAFFTGEFVVIRVVIGELEFAAPGVIIRFQFDVAGAFALGAAALGAVEGETAGCVAAEAGFGGLGEELADVVEEADVGGGGGAGGAADGGLVYLMNGFDRFKAGDVGLEFRVES